MRVITVVVAALIFVFAQRPIAVGQQPNVPVQNSDQTPAANPVLPDQLPAESSSFTVLTDGETTGKPGRLIRLRAVAENAVNIKWLLVGGEEDFYEVCDNGTKCLFVSPTPGKFTLVCAASRSDGALDVIQIPIEIVGDLPAPGPGPGPAPGPGPTPGPQPAPLPDGKYKLAQTVADLCRKVPNSAKYKTLFSKLSANYNAKASKVAAGAVKSPEDLLLETRTSNAEIVGTEREALIKPLFQPLSDAVSKANLDTLEDFTEAWREIATGFLAGAE